MYKKFGITHCFVACALATLSLSAQAYHVAAGKVIDDSTGATVQINGFAWSGFQDGKILDGLSGNPLYAITSSTQPRAYGMMDLMTHAWDFPSGVSKQTAVAFHTVRIPIQPGVLDDETNHVNVNQAITDKAHPTEGNGIFCQTWETNGKACSETVTVKDAFWKTLAEFNKHDTRVLVDIHHHRGYGDGERDGKVYDMAQYSADMTTLAKTIKAKDLNNVVGIDIFNEPHVLNWFQPNDGQVAWTKVIATAANAVYANNPNLLLFVEGPDNGNDDKDEPAICVAKNSIVPDPNAYSYYADPSHCGTNAVNVSLKGNWGEDFKPLLNPTQAAQGKAVFDRAHFEKALTDAGISAKALTWLMGDANGNGAHLVFSPHVYPASVAGWESAPGKPSALRFDWNWGFLNKAGYPVVIGESSWSKSGGKPFFTKALMPYLQNSTIGTHNVFFWGVGYLGDTISGIDMGSGKLNLDMEQTLKPFFGGPTPAGSLKVAFTQNAKFSGNVKLNVTGNTSEKFDCDLAQGCTVQLNPGKYNASIDSDYQVDNGTHALYELNSAKPVAVTVSQDHTSTVTVPIISTFKAKLATHTVKVNLNLQDQSGKPVSAKLLQPLAVKLTATDNASNTSQCQLDSEHCNISLYNTAINNKGIFNTEDFSLSLPQQIKDITGKVYYLVTQTTAKDVSVHGNTAETLELTLTYKQNKLPPKTGCNLSLNVQNSWGTGAVIQGNISNQSNNAIRQFTLEIDVPDQDAKNLKVTNSWIGNNATAQIDGHTITLTADSYDNYNGIAKGQSQTVGFQLNGQFGEALKLSNLQCSAR